MSKLQITMPYVAAVAMLALSVVTRSTIARAQPATVGDEPAADVVLLRNGEVLHGRVTEVQPSASLTMVLVGGTQRTVSLADVELANGPGFSFPAPALVAPPMLAQPASDDLRDPGPGRVPLIVESVGHSMTAGESFGTRGLSRGGPPSGHELCNTPCTLYVHPGLFSLLTAGDGIVRHETRLDIPSNGMRVRMRAPRTAWFVGMLVLEELCLVPLEFLGLWITTPDDGVRDAGIALSALGITGVIADLVGFGIALRGGVVQSTPIQQAAQTPHLDLAAVPIQGGGMVGASIRF